MEKLETLLDNEQKRESMSKELQSYIMEIGSFPNYCKTLNGILDIVIQKELV